MKVTLLFLLLIFSNAKLLAQENYDVVQIDSFSINGKIKLTTTKSNLKNVFGKSLVISKFQPECGYYASIAEEDLRLKFYTYKSKNIEYIVYKNIADFSEILLSKDKSSFLLYIRYKISATTSLIELKKMFPKSYKEFVNEKSEIFRLFVNEKIVMIGYI